MRHTNTVIRNVVRFVSVRVSLFVLIIAAGVGFMFFAEDVNQLLFMELMYAIVLLAFITVVLSDFVDTEIRQRLSAAT